MPTQNTVKFDSRLKQGDYIKISLLLFFHGWRNYAVGAIFCIGAVLFLAGVTIIPLLVIVIVTALFVFITIMKATSSRSRHFYLPRKLIINEEGIRGKSSIYNEKLDWEDILTVKRLSAYYLFYFAREKFLAIPERDIPAVNKERFDELISEKTGVSGQL